MGHARKHHGYSDAHMMSRVRNEFGSILLKENLLFKIDSANLHV